MSNFYNFKMPKDYVEKVNSQPIIPGQDFTPRVIRNLLTTDELETLKKDFDNYRLDKIRVQGHNGMGNLDINFSNKKSIIEKIEKLVGEICGEEVEVLESNAIRYSPSFGWFVKFGPHYDARPVEMFVLDYHVQATEDWAVFVEGKKFNVHDNEALLFNGTGQVHWREQKHLREDANIDIVLFWIQHKVPKPISKEHADTMRARANWVVDIIDPPPTLEKKDWWSSIQISDAVLKYPDFKKISSEHKNPLSHNTVYNNGLLGLKDVEYLSDPKPGDIFTVPQDIIDRVSLFMTHVHAESKIEYLDTKVIKYSNKEDLGYLYNSDRDIISLAIPINSNADSRIFIGDKAFDIDRFSALTFSPTNQSVGVGIGSQDDESFVEIAFFNFWLKEVY